MATPCAQAHGLVKDENPRNFVSIVKENNC